MTRRRSPSRVELEAAATRSRPLEEGEHPEGSSQSPDLEYVPTLPELARRGLAQPVGKDGSHYRATPEGQALLYAIMSRNAARMRADDDLRRRVEVWAVTAARRA